MTRFRRKSAALNLVRIIPVWHTPRENVEGGKKMGGGLAVVGFIVLGIIAIFYYAGR